MGSDVGCVLIHTASVNVDAPQPKPLAYSVMKAAIQNFGGGPVIILAETQMQ